MKKLAVAGLSLVVGIAAVASTGLLARKAILSEERPKTEIRKKSVRLPFGAKGVSKQLPKGLSVCKGVSRVGRAKDIRKRAYAMETASGASVYGWLGYYSSDEGDTSERGLNKVNTDGTWTPIFSSECISLGMGVTDGVAYAQIYESDWDGVSYVADITVDIATGELLSETEIDMETEPEKFFYGLAYDMESMTAYGYHVVGEETIEFASKDLTTGVVTGIAESENLYKMVTFNQSTGEVVCIDLDSSALIGVDTATGAETLKGTVDITSDYVGGLCWSPKDNAYIWNPNAQDWSYLVKISETGETEKICDVQLAGQYQAMCCADLAAVDPGAPARAEMKSVNFGQGAVDGHVTWAIPDKTEGGTPLSGSVGFTVCLDGAEYRQGTAVAGKDLTVEFTGLASALHTFKIVLSVDGKTGRATTFSHYIGNDTPKAPASVTLTRETVSWDAVTDGLHKGYIDLSKLRYNVRLNGVTIAENVAGTSCPTGLAAGTPLESYVAEVEATCNGLTSSATSSNGIVFGEPLDLPLQLEPREQQASLFVVSDENGDGCTWEFTCDDEMGDCFRYQYGYEMADDWLFLPPVKVADTGRMLYFAMDYAAKAGNMPEAFEVKIGVSPDAASMTTLLAERGNVSNTSYETAEAYFTLPEAGVYYIGIHALSEPDMFYLFAKNFIMEQSDITSAGPAAVSDASAVAGDQGALNATVTFTLPVKTIGGADIPADATVKATVKSEAGSNTAEGKPGSRQSVTLATAQGMNSISIQAETGGNSGAVTKISVYTGLDIPGIPTDLKAEVGENNCTARISWGAPVTGENGGYVRPEGIKYSLCQYTFFGWMPIGELGTDVYEYTVEVPEGTPQDRYDIGILCENEAGQATYLATVHPVLGMPYQLPAVEKFAGGNLTYTPVSISGDADAEYIIADPAELGEEFAGDFDFALIGQSYDWGKGEVILPKFSTKGMDHAAFEFGYYYNTGSIKVYAQAYGTEKVQIFDSEMLDCNGYSTWRVVLPDEMQDKGWVTFTLENDFSLGETFILTGYRVRNLVKHDLAVSVSGPSSTSLGEKLRYVATVTNEGTMYADFNGGKWTVRKGGDVIAETVMTPDKVDMLSPDGSVTVEFETVADAGYIGEVTVEYTVAGDDDNAANNVGSVKTSVSKGKAVVVTDFDAAVCEEGVALTWSAPLGQAAVESFENETPFVLSPDKVGVFKNIDRDGGEVYTWNGGDGIWSGAGMPGAFSVFSSLRMNEVSGEPGAFDAVDGDKFLIAFCPVPVDQGGTADVADDWLISPECVGGSEFSFSLRSLTEQYGDETIEVLVAKDSSDSDDFTLLQSISVCDETNWERFSFRLPADANYFAIRYTSEDIFGIMVDAIEYQPAGVVVDVKGYEIYRQAGSSEFEKIAEVTGTGYVDSGADASALLRYYVVPLLADGTIGEKSNIASAQASGLDSTVSETLILAGHGEILLVGFDGCEYAVYAVNGTEITRGVASGNERIAVNAGVYVVRVASRSAKVTVK